MLQLIFQGLINPSVDDIKQAFAPFYTATSLSEATDINVLHELKEGLDEVGVYEWAEAMLHRRKEELELYKLFANDEAFKVSWRDSLQRLFEGGA